MIEAERVQKPGLGRVDGLFVLDRAKPRFVARTIDLAMLEPVADEPERKAETKTRIGRS